MEKANATAKVFPAVRHSLPGIESDIKGGRTTQASWNSKNNSRVGFLDAAGGGDTSRTTAVTRKTGKTFGFRNHSFALGSTVRHFNTMSDFPAIPSKLERAKSNMNDKDAQKMTASKVPDIMDVLKQDPKALEIFMEELALADKKQPRHLRFLSDI